MVHITGNYNETINKIWHPAIRLKTEKTLHLWNMFTPTLVILVSTTLVVYTNMCTNE